MKAQFEPILFNENHAFNATIQNKKEFDYPFHYHPEFELTYIFSSSGIRYIGNSFEDFKSNDLVLIGPDLPHCWKNSYDNKDNASALVIQWKDDFLGKGCTDLIELEKVWELQKKASKGIKFTDEIAIKLKKRLISIVQLPPFKRLIVFLEILNELAECDQYKILCEQGFTANLNHVDNERINTVYQFVKKHYKEKITLKAVSAEVNMTEESFSRFFSKIMKKGFFIFLNEYRINNACKILIETDKQVAEVCYDSGYESISFFYRQFKKVKHCSPQHFRLLFKKTGDHLISVR